MKFKEAVFMFELPDKSNRYMARWIINQDNEAECTVFDAGENLGTFVCRNSTGINRTRSEYLIKKAKKLKNG